jgi:hypothetical protein
MDAAEATLFRKMWAAQVWLMEARGLDLAWGRRLYRCLREHGLVNLSLEGYVAVWKGGSPGARLTQANFEQIREEVVNAGLITNEEVDQVLALLDDPDFAINSLAMFTATGQRP